jgi:8-oxo-dGTP diphosphatase
MADNPILAAGGIVVRGNTRPTVALVQLRKDGNWVLPKGKLNRGEDALAAAQREVHEETGHTVTVKEFVGTLCYEVNGRSKIVQFWRMHPNGGPARELMDDIKQVAWLPLEKAIRKLARPHEKAFLASAGPAAIKSHRETTAIRALPSAAAQAPATAPVTAAEPVVVQQPVAVHEPVVAYEPVVAHEPAPMAMTSVNSALSHRRKFVARAWGWLRRRKA